MSTPTSDTASSGMGAGDLFQLLRDGSPRTRAELAKSTGLARSTIASRVDELMRLGLVEAVAEGASTGGRPPSLFALNPRARVVLAVDVGASHLRLALTDLTGAILVERDERIEISQGPEAVLTRVAAAAEILLDDAARDSHALVAIGIGVPGPVEHASGQPVNPPIMPGWNRFDVPGWIRDRFGVPVLVDNDVNIMALGERAAAWPHTQDLIFVKVATGIGAGVMSGGRLLRGAQGVAGDIGHVRVARASDVPCRCGNTGCLEAVASGPAIARTLRESGRDVADAGKVIELVRHGDRDAIQAVRQAGRDIGEVLNACVSLLNPSVVVLGGSMSQVGEHLIAGVREVVYTRSTPLATKDLAIVASATGAEAAVIGAGMLAADHVLSPGAFHQLAR